MTTYYVATLASYVLVDADSEAVARERGRVALQELFTDVRHRLGQDMPIEIRTVRPATLEEIELGRWHDAMSVHESNSQGRRTLQ